MNDENLSEGIQFQGLPFLTNIDVEVPIQIKSDDKSQAYTDCTDLVSFLNTLKNFGVLNEKNETGLIVVVDDQFVNQQSMKLNFADIGITDRLIQFSNGQEVVDYFDSLLEDYKNHETEAPL